jgi:hypothetical protein
MDIGGWIGSSVGFIAVMLGAMGIGVSLVGCAALATMRRYVAGEDPETSPGLVADPPTARVPAPVRPIPAGPGAVRLVN